MMRQKVSIAILVLFIFFGLSSPLFSKKEYEQIAHYYLDIMNYEEAVFYYKQALAESPRKKNIKDKLGYAYFKLGRYEDAIKVLREEMIKYPSNLNALILLCLIHYQQGDEEEATKFCERFHRAFQMVLQKEKKKLARKYRLTETNLRILSERLRQTNPNLGLPYFILGMYNKRKDRMAKALSDLERALEAGYDPVKCYAQIIDASLRQQDWQRAIILSRDAQRAVGEKYELYFLRGYALYQNGQYDDAVFCFKKALELRPYAEEVIRNLALLFHYRGEYDEALPLFKRFLKLVPYDYDIKFMLERLEKKTPEFKTEKKSALTKKVAEETKLKFCYVFQTDVQTITDDINYKAIALLRSGQRELATGFMHNFLEIYDRSPGLNYNLAQFYSMKDNPGKALEYVWRAVELKPDFKEAHDLVGSIFLELEDYQNSISSYKKVIAIDPEDAVGHYNLGCAYSALRDYPKAEEAWKKALKLDTAPSEEKKEENSSDQLSVSVVVEARRVSFNCRRALGEMYANHGHHKEALMQYLAAQELEPRNANPYYEIGKLYLKLNYPQKATEYFEEYLYLGGKRVKEIQKILEDIKKLFLPEYS
ncbi:MAG: tetratricopeptide repeat protein [Candidatus Aminicenantes bacterium]